MGCVWQSACSPSAQDAKTGTPRDNWLAGLAEFKHSGPARNLATEDGEAWKKTSDTKLWLLGPSCAFPYMCSPYMLTHIYKGTDSSHRRILVQK